MSGVDLRIPMIATAIPTDRDQLFRSITTRAALVMRALLDEVGKSMSRGLALWVKRREKDRCEGMIGSRAEG